MQNKASHIIKKDTIHVVMDDKFTYVISENYFYKTEAYYTIFKNEIEGKNTLPSSSDVVEAYVVPLSLIKAKLAGIPVCDWEISYAYAPLPSIIYSLNYFSDSSDYFIVSDSKAAKETIKHVTNNGKYPFCYQKTSDSSAIKEYVSIFGRSANTADGVSSLVEKIYAVFRIPFVNIVFVVADGKHYLSSLTPVRYSKLSREDKNFLENILRENRVQ